MCCAQAVLPAESGIAHTQRKNTNQRNSLQIGTTVDDAIGEAYDKVARMLGLELTPSGGPALEQLARSGDPHKYPFTMPLREKRTCDFSYSGLKTAVRAAVERDVGQDLGPDTLKVRPT